MVLSTTRIVTVFRGTWLSKVQEGIYRESASWLPHSGFATRSHKLCVPRIMPGKMAHCKEVRKFLSADRSLWYTIFNITKCMAQGMAQGNWAMRT